MAETVVVNFSGNDDVTPAAKSAEKGIKGVGDAAEKQNSKFNGLKEIATGALRGIGEAAIGAAGSIASSIGSGVVDFFGSAIQGSMDYQNTLAQTEAVIRSTGGAAGYSVEQMEEMARSMSAAAGASLFPDDAILGAQNILATFTQIKGIQFEGATQSALDMAQALGMDASSAAMMMGKALNDPVAGMSALSRSGVSFTEDQKDMVKAMVEAGDVAGAQNLILGEMANQFGGSAAAATETFAGRMTILSEKFEDAKGSIGDALLPVLTRFANIAEAYIIPVAVKIFESFGAWITGLDWDGIVTKISGLINAFISFGTGIDWNGMFASIRTFIDLMVAQIPTVVAVIQPVVNTIIGIVLSLVNIFTGPEMQSIVGSVMNVVNAIAPLFGTLIGAIQPVIAQIITSVQSLLPPIAEVIAMISTTLSSPTVISAFQGIIEIAGLLGQIFVQIAEIYIASLIAQFNELWPTVDSVIKGIGAVINTVIPFVKSILESLIMYLNGDTTGAVNKLKETFSTAWEGISTAVQTGIDAVKAKLKEWIDGAAQFGRDLVAGIASGISSSAGKIADAAKTAANNALSAAKALLGIASPSKVMAKQVGLPIGQGMAAGIMESIPAIRGAMAVSLGAAQGQATQSVQNYYLSATYNTAQSESSLRQDLRAMQLLSGAV